MVKTKHMHINRFWKKKNKNVVKLLPQKWPFCHQTWPWNVVVPYTGRLEPKTEKKKASTHIRTVQDRNATLLEQYRMAMLQHRDHTWCWCYHSFWASFPCCVFAPVMPMFEKRSSPLFVQQSLLPCSQEGECYATHVAVVWLILIALFTWLGDTSSLSWLFLIITT